jgi:alkanesulfonate monooxygenase SsuD/methylene tetrahydromethanopterin reductase-like flavin-dependent oxidoreductase (luciferase family)
VISLAEVARLVEDAPLDILWLVEGGPDAIDPVPLAGSLAGATTGLGIGITIRPSRGRHPSVVARDVTAIDLLTDGRAAVALVEDGEGPLDVDRLGEAASMLHLLFSTEEVTVSGRFYEVAELTIRPRPVHPEGPPIVAGLLGRTESGERSIESVMVEASADAYLTGGTRNDVAASRTRLDGVAPAGERPVLLWRGSLGADHAAAVDLAASLLESGADGLIAVLEPDGAVGPQLAAGAIGRVLDVLGPLAGRLGS